MVTGSTRGWHRAASALALIAAGAHFAQHLSVFPAGSPVGAFSFSYAVLLALFGTSQWILAREADPRTLRRHALRNAVLLLIALAMLAWRHPQPQVLVVLGAMALLYALAAWPRELDL